MEKTQLYVPEEMSVELERLRLKFGDEKISQTARRVLRVGFEKLKAEEGHQG